MSLFQKNFTLCSDYLNNVPIRSLESSRCFNFGLVIFKKKESNWLWRKGDKFQVHPLLEQRAKEDVLQKEVRVKILKDNITLLAAKVPSGGQELTSELNVVLENYQLLCNRIRGKCHTLEVRCF